MNSLAAPVHRRQPVSKWGGVARAVGTGIMQLGELNYREKMLKERDANLERIRTESNARDDKKTADNRIHQKEMAQESRNFSASQNKLNRNYRTEDREDNQIFQSDKQEDQQKHQIELASMGGKGGSGNRNAKIQLIEYYKAMEGVDGKPLFTSEEAVNKANTLNDKSPKSVYQKLLSDIIRSGVSEGAEAEALAKEMTEKAFNFKLGDPPPKHEGGPGVSERLPDESISDWINRIVGK